MHLFLVCFWSLFRFLLNAVCTLGFEPIIILFYDFLLTILPAISMLKLRINGNEDDA